MFRGPMDIRYQYNHLLPGDEYDVTISTEVDGRVIEEKIAHVYLGLSLLLLLLLFVFHPLLY